jgi:hypothetical protein
MGETYKVGITENLVSGECGGGRGWRKEEGKDKRGGEERRKQGKKTKENEKFKTMQERKGSGARES